jgi:hypothetical protein
MPKPSKLKQQKQPEYLPLRPDRFYRRNEVIEQKYLGYSDTQLEEKIRAGEIDPPVRLSRNGRAVGWFGRTIIKLRAEFEAAGKRKAKVA